MGPESMFRQVYDPVTGQAFLVPVDPGLTAEQQDHLRPGGLPEAELAGAEGVGVVPLRNPHMIGARPGGGDTPPPTWRPLAGARPNNRGNQATLDAPQVLKVGESVTTGGPTHITSIVETSKDAGDDAESILVTLGVNWSPDLSPGENRAPGNNEFARFLVCNLTWGIGNAVFQADLDWITGLAFPITASFVRVGATYNVFGNFLANIEPPSAILTASLAYGWSGGRSSSTRITKNTGSLDPNGGANDTVLLQVPHFATSFGIVSGGFGGNPSKLANVNVLGGALNFGLANYVWSNNTNQGQQIESTYMLPGGSEWLQITNGDNIAAEFFVVFNLSIG